MSSGLDRMMSVPSPRQQFVETVDRMSADHSLQHVTQVCVRLDVIELARLDQRTENCPSSSAAVATGKEVVLAAERHRSDRSLDGVRVEFDAAVMEEAGQSIPARQRIPDRLGEIAAAGQLRELHLEPKAKAVNDRLGEGAPRGQPMRRRLTTHLRFDSIEAGDATQGLVRDGRVLGLRNLVELAPGVRPTCGE